jgi:hypothetical protein
MEQINVPIEGEADASELRRVIYAMSQKQSGFITPKEIKAVLDLLPDAIGYCLANSAPEENDSLRLEMSKGLIVHAVPKEKNEGEAFGHPFNMEDHYKMYVKFSGRANDAIAKQLGWEVKNG